MLSVSNTFLVSKIIYYYQLLIDFESVDNLICYTNRLIDSQISFLFVYFKRFKFSKDENYYFRNIPLYSDMESNCLFIEIGVLYFFVYKN